MKALTRTIDSLLVEEFQPIRFKIADVQKRVFEEHPEYWALDILCRDKGANFVRNDISASINRRLELRTKDDHRIWFHSVIPDADGKCIWFHSELSEPWEEERFGKYLLDLTRPVVVAGRYHVANGRRRAKTAGKVAA
jgi:hypothetical protein